MEELGGVQKLTVWPGVAAHRGYAELIVEGGCLCASI